MKKMRKKMNEENEFKVVENKRTRKRIPPINVTPTEKSTKGEENTPPVSYADVLFRNMKKPPKEIISKQQIEAAPELKEAIEKDIKENRKPQELNNEELNIVKNEIWKSNHIVGIRPITMENIHKETEKLIKNGHFDRTKESNKAVSTATKNELQRFFRDKLKMDDSTRNDLQITKIFTSRNPEAKILYVQCENTDEIAKITSLAKNIERTNLKEYEASIAIHIPKILYKRYLDIERLMYQLRNSAKGNIQTNVRLGRTDFLSETKNEGR